MLTNQSDLKTLPMMAMKEVPQAAPNAKTIVALVKHSGRVTGYQLSDGTIVDKAQGVQLARQGEIQGVGIAEREGTEYLKSLPDGSEGNNLNSLPTVTQ